MNFILIFLDPDSVDLIVIFEESKDFFSVDVMTVNAFRSVGVAIRSETALMEETNSTASPIRFKIALQKNSYVPTTVAFW